jgi:hypothetical protein
VVAIGLIGLQSLQLGSSYELIAGTHFGIALLVIAALLIVNAVLVPLWSKVVSDGERLRALAGGVFVEYCQFCIRKVAGMDGNRTHLGPVIGAPRTVLKTEVCQLTSRCQRSFPSSI